MNIHWAHNEHQIRVHWASIENPTRIQWTSIEHPMHSQRTSNENWFHFVIPAEATRGFEAWRLEEFGRGDGTIRFPIFIDLSTSVDPRHPIYQNSSNLRISSNSTPIIPFDAEWPNWEDAPSHTAWNLRKVSVFAENASENLSPICLPVQIPRASKPQSLELPRRESLSEINL